jgi:hypothetical protein
MLLSMLLQAALAEDIFAFPNLNPFATKSAADSARASSFATHSPNTAKRRSAEPSTWDRFSNGTKTFFTKTKGVLMPWTKHSDVPSPSPTGTRRVYPASSGGKSAPKKSFFSSWFDDEDEVKPPTTVNEFLAQPRVPFE